MKLRILGLFWTLIYMLPLTLLPDTAFEHRLYLPAIGLVLVGLEFNNSRSNINSLNKLTFIIIILVFSCLSFYNSTNYKNAHSFWYKAWNTSPHSAHVHFHMGIYYQLQGKVTEAIKEYEKAIKIQPNKKDVRNNLGKIFLNAGHFSDAEKLFKEELKINPSSMPYYNLGALEQKRGNLNTAEKYLIQSIKIDSNHVDAIVDLGSIYAVKGMYNSAINLFNRAINLDSNNMIAYKNLTLLYIVSNNEIQAKQHYMVSKKIGVNFEPYNIDSLILSIK